MTDAPAFHPAANLFPLMEESALGELAADIAAYGLREPIWRHRDGRIIDGRNRWLACAKVGVTCHGHTYQYDDDSIVPFVISHNLHRRHLTTAQRAAIAADLATMPKGQKKSDRPDGLSQSEAANLFNVSVKSIKRAKVLKEVAPEIHERVKSGAISAREVAATIRERNNGKDKRQKGAPKMDAPAPIKPKIALVHDRDDGLVEQVFALLHRLREVAGKTTPDDLYSRMPDRLMHNLDLSLDRATWFLTGLQDVHRARSAEKKNAAV